MIWEEILLYSLLFLALLYIIGHVSLGLLGRFSAVESLLGNLDPVERLPVEFVVGGAVIYTWALLATPFGAFNYLASWIITIAFAALFSTELLAKIRKSKSVDVSRSSWAALGVFFVGLVIRVFPLQDYSLGSVTDSSLHTLFVYSIISRGGIPESAIPGAVLQYPQGLHVVLAYFTMISGLPPELTVFYELAYFNATILLAAYFLARVLASRQFALIVELLLLGISLYPIVITWGGQIIPWGFTIFFVFMALIFQKFTTEKSGFPRTRDKAIFFVLPGVILGYLGSTYTPLYALAIIALVLSAIFTRKNLVEKLESTVILVLASLPLFAIWIFRVFGASNYNSPFLIQESNTTAYDAALAAGLQWFPFKYMTSLSGISSAIYSWIDWPVRSMYPGSAYAFPMLIILGSGLLILAFLSREHLSLSRRFLYYVLAVFVTALIWGSDNPVGLFYFAAGPISILTSELNKAAVIVGTILIPFVAAIPIYLLVLYLSRRNAFQFQGKKLVTAIVLAVLLVSNFAVLPFSNQWLVGNYGVYAVASSNDYQLLQWMRTGIPNKSIVLVNPYDAGQYVQSISNKASIGFFTGLTYPTYAYERIFKLLVDGIINQTTVSLLKDLNVSYIFVGSRAIQSGWSSSLFISHCLAFKDVQNFYTAYLFQVISTQYVAASEVCNFI